MQEPAVRPNKVRSETTRDALLSAARRLFVEKGFSETSTPEIVAAAGVTRGALYHHFNDKRDVLQALLEREAAEIRQAIDGAEPVDATAADALLSGSAAYLAAMTVPGRTRLMLVEGPAVLGPAAMAEIDRASAQQALREGLAAALSPSDRRRYDLDVLTALLSATFDRAAVTIEEGADRKAVERTMIALVERIVGL